MNSDHKDMQAKVRLFAAQVAIKSGNERVVSEIHAKSMKGGKIPMKYLEPFTTFSNGMIMAADVEAEPGTMYHQDALKDLLWYAANAIPLRDSLDAKKSGPTCTCFFCTQARTFLKLYSISQNVKEADAKRAYQELMQGNISAFCLAAMMLNYDVPFLKELYLYIKTLY